MKISVSYLKHLKTIEQTILDLNQTSADFIHVDLMDGIFAGSEKNYEIKEVLRQLSFSRHPLDIHLMVSEPEMLIEHLAILNPYNITIHVEIENVSKYLFKIKGLGIKAGLAINPDTPFDVLVPYLKDIDLVLVMSVTPGAGGQSFQKSVIDTLNKLKTFKENNHYSFEISVDGGITDETISMVSSYVDRVVSGSFICMHDHFEEQIQKLKENNH